MKNYKLTQSLHPNTRNALPACLLSAHRFGDNKKQFALAWRLCVASALLVTTLLSPSLGHAGDPAGNGAVRVAFESEERLVPTGPPGRIWVSDDGVQHIRDFPLAGPVWGDLNGTLTTSFNINLNLTTGDGTAFGTFVLDVEWNGLRGTFEGRAHAKYEGFLISGQGSGHGTGGFEGMEFRGYFFNDGPRVPLIGTILIPPSN